MSDWSNAKDLAPQAGAPSQSGLLANLVHLFSVFPEVEAIALAGSRTSGLSPDAVSDYDLCLFTKGIIPLTERQALVEKLGGALQANLGHTFWGLCDEWVHSPSGVGVDVVYWDTGWVEDLLRRVIDQHQPSLGYSTAHWFTIRNAQPLFDRTGWLARIQSRSRAPYPEELRQAIIRDNLAVLRDMISSYRAQVVKALGRGDIVSINHRIAGLFASYFDVIFAANRVLHPGEKRLLEQAARLCASLPPHMEEDVTAVLQSTADPGPALIDHIDRLVDRLEGCLETVD